VDILDRPNEDIPTSTGGPQVVDNRTNPMWKFVFIGFILLVAAVLVSVLKCAVTQDMPAIETAIGHFHDLYNAQDFEQTYSEAGQEMFKTTSKGDYLEFMRAVRRKLGSEVKSVRAGWRVDKSLSLQTTVTQGQTTTFENGDGTETFTFKFDGDKPILIGYHISSRALVLK
jgi:hypothetical protein